jgi:hypothetical protein
MDLLTLRYLARRISSMGSMELFHRARVMMEQRVGRIRFRTDPEAMSWSRVWADREQWLVQDNGNRFADTVTQALLAALPSGWWQEQSFWDTFAQRYPSERSQLLAMAEEALEGRIRLFQWKTVTLSEPIQWSQTFEPDRPDAVWPSEYFADIDVLHDPSRQERDVRWCWELNRFQHLLWLGAAWRLTGLDKYACVARCHLESWLASVSYPAGVQWQSNLEVALRVLSWARCHILCMNNSSWDPLFMESFLAGLYVHARHLYRELGVHLPIGNHLLGEASALYCIATLYPSLVEAKEWSRTSIAILNQIVPRLIRTDGTYAEEAIGYLRFVLEFLLPVLRLSRGRNTGLAPVVIQRVARAADCIRSLSRAFGEVPMMGDSDTGLAIGWQLSDFWDFSPLCAATAVLLDRPELADHLESMPAEAFLMVGNRDLRPSQRGTDETLTVQGEPASHVLDQFPAGSFTISRDDRFAVGLDTGPLGLGPGYCHGHADALSLTLNFEGKTAIVDPGTGLYNGLPRWRGYFRSTAAHSTIRIDDRDPSIPFNTFRWSDPIDVGRDPVRQGKGWCAIGGTVNWPDSLHHRVVLHLIDSAILVFDRVNGQGPHHVESRLQLAPEWTLHRRSDRVVAASRDDSELEILWLSPEDDGLVLLHGSDAPMAGWYSRYYGSIMPTSTISASFAGTLPWRAITVFKPSGACFSMPEDPSLIASMCDFSDLLDSEAFHQFCLGDRDT